MATSIDPDDARRTLDAELERGRSLAADASTLEALEEADRAVLGRKAPLSLIGRELAGLSDEDRRTVGQRVHEVREALRTTLALRREALEAERESGLLEADRVDVTL